MVEIYCPFDFSNFPFDKHDCNFTFGLKALDTEIARLTPPIINYEDQFSAAFPCPGYCSSLGQIHIKISSESLPFYMELSSMETISVKIDQSAFLYDQAGISIHFSRKSLGNLSGSFYGPTAIFAILSLISFHIHPDKVSIHKYCYAPLMDNYSFVYEIRVQIDWDFW